MRKGTVYVSLASRHPFYAVNYDRIFAERPAHFFSWHAGVSIEKEYVSLPVGIAFMKGVGPHHAEIDLTFIPSVKDYRYLFDGTNRSDKFLFIAPLLGYRYQKRSGGLLLKVSAGPFISLDPRSDDFWKMDARLYAAAQVAFGYSF